MTLTVGSLFSGIGGIDLGLQMAGGFETRWFCEIDPWCRKVLAKHWPGVPCYEDIHHVRGCDVETVDVLAGGFPCQPVSLAGKRKGQEDSRWLWPEFARLIRELRPRYALMENVPGLRSRGMSDVLADLAACGYDAEWDCIPASALGAHHQRDRIWIVAYPGGVVVREGADQPAGVGATTGESRGSRKDAVCRSVARCGGETHVAYADSQRSDTRSRLPVIEWSGLSDANGGSGSSAGSRREDVADTNRNRPTERGERQAVPGACVGWGYDRAGSRSNPRQVSVGITGQGATGVPDADRESMGWLAESRCQRREWESEPNVGRVAHGIPRRVDRLRGLGNAVVPQVVAHVGRLILEAEAR